MHGCNSYVSRIYGFIAVVFVGATLGILAGCQKSAHQSGDVIGNTVDLTAEADLQRKTEVELVERMAQYRNQYQRHLRLLKEFYDQQGNHLKSAWAHQELENLKYGPRHSYLVVAELAGPDMEASSSIIEADMMYEEAVKLYNEGKGGIGGLFSDQKKLYKAIETFNEMITRYPSSDKIDDAAFYIAQIYHQHLKDYHKALLYYQRVWQWDAMTPYAPRYYVARIYDEHLHDRVKALEFYHRSINLENNDPAKVEFAKSRIGAINKELSQ